MSSEKSRDVVPFSELSYDEAKLMRVFASHSEPIGARLASRELSHLGLELSEATVSRLFSKLDTRGYTRPVGRKGRLATREGRRRANSAFRDELTSSQLNKALDIRAVDQLLDLLHTRRGVEGEAAILAAERATPEDLAALRENVEAYEAAVDEQEAFGTLGNDFHRLVLKAAHSPLLETMSTLILNDQADSLEPVLLVITTGHGTTDPAPREHADILRAIERRDGEAAQKALTSHLTRFITEVEEFARANDNDLFERLLKLAR